MPAKFPVYIEVGSKRVFASALNWPGWTRSAKSENEAIESLVEYGPRYAKVVSRLGFVPPKSGSAMNVLERVKGDATTDFGAPAIPSSADAKPLKSDELSRLVTILQRCWTAFDEAAAAHKRKTLRTGPRGGGRSVAKMVSHVLEADRAYLSRLGGASRAKDTQGIHADIIEALAARARGEEPRPNPRRTKPLWVPRYAVRRSAWHALDHAWEIEDRVKA
jgi:hypothetical protein